MTPQEKHHAVETAIRKALPRLMEPTEGCLFKDNWTNEVSEKVGLYRTERGKKVAVLRDNSTNEIFVDYSNTFRINLFYKDASHTTIGHDILLSDVLEWLGKFGHKASIHSRAEFVVFVKKREYIFTRYSTYIDLSKPRLADQSEELINFLYNLIKKN